jgi:hypothetical protein
LVIVIINEPTLILSPASTGVLVLKTNGEGKSPKFKPILKSTIDFILEEANH